MHQLLQSLLNCLYAAHFKTHVNITDNQRPPAISNVQRAEHFNSVLSILDCKMAYGLPAARKQRRVRQVWTSWFSPSRYRTNLNNSAENHRPPGPSVGRGRMNNKKLIYSSSNRCIETNSTNTRLSKYIFLRAWKPWGPSSCWNVMVLRAGGSSRGFANRFSLRRILVNMYVLSLSPLLSFFRSSMHSPHSAHCAMETLKSEEEALYWRTDEVTLLSAANISSLLCGKQK